MNAVDIIIVAVAVLIVAGSVFYRIRRKRKGKNSCGCSSCDSCSSCPGHQQKKD